MAVTPVDITQTQPVDVTQQQSIEPKLFEYNGSLYDYDEFKKLAYDKLGETFSKYGKKYYNSIDELKQDLDTIITAIGEDYNGKPRIHIYDDRIEDMKGLLMNDKKHKNSNKPIKDKMGYIGGHIISVLKSMSPYLKPEPEAKKLLSQEVLRKDVLNTLFNQDTAPQNLTDWYNLDPLEENKRANTNRINELKNALNRLNYTEDEYEIPELFKDYKDVLNSILSDNNISENEYYNLNRLFGWDNGINWNALLKTDFSPEPTETQLQEDRGQQPEIKSEEDNPKPISKESDVDEMAKLLTSFESLSSGINIEDVFSSPEVLTYFTQKLGVDADSILQIALLKLIKDGKAIPSNGKHYFPTITNKNGMHPVLTIGNNKRSIDWVNENDKDWAVMPQNAKKGGVLKALLGTGLTYNSDWNNDFINLIDWNTSDNERYKHTIYNGNVSLSHRSGTGARNTIAPTNTKYNIENGGKDVEGQDYWNNWTRALTTNKNLAEAWARRYRELEQHTKNSSGKETNHYSTWFNADDTFNFGNFKLSNLWSDEKNGIGHDIYKGNIYFIEDENGEKRYYSKKDLEDNGYVQDNEYESDFNNPLLTEYKYVKKAPEEPETRAEEPAESTAATSTDSGSGSTLFNKLDTGGGDQTSTKKKSNFEINWIPELIDVFGLGSSWYFNKKAFNARKRRPYLTLSPEYKTFVRGDLNAYLAGVNQGADLMSRTNLFGMTSDANSNNAAMFNAWLNASKYKDQGRQEYDKKTYETLQKANELGWKNIDSHIANANSNKKNIYETQWYNGDLKGQYYISNYNSLQNFLNNLKQPFLDDRAQKKYLKLYSEEEKNSLLLKTLSSKELADYKRRLNEWTEQFLKDYPSLKDDYKYAYNPIYQQGVDTLSNQYYLNLMTVLLNNNLEGNLGTYDAGYTKTLADWMKKYRELRTQNTQTEP